MNAATAPLPNAPSQMFDDVKAYFRRVDALAKEEGQGALARPEFAITTAIAAFEGHIGPDDAQAAWDRFRSAKAKKLEASNVVEKSAKMRHSELRQIIIASVLPALRDQRITGTPTFADLLQTAKPIISAAKDEGVHKGSTWDGMVNIARRQIEKKDQALTEDEIAGALVPKTQDKDESEKAELEKIVKTMQKVYEGKSPTDDKPGRPGYQSEELASAMELLNERIAALGTAKFGGKQRRKAA
jgi:hypothetical protein